MTVLLALRIVAALGCGLMAGVFFAFSTSVMRGLARLGPAEAIAAMQAMNRAILNPLFLACFFGSAVACILAMVSALWQLPDPAAVCTLAGGTLYLVGAILVTMAVNVPLNRALDAVATGDPGSASRWSAYLAKWTAWNHVRAATALAAAALLTIAIWLQPAGAGTS